MRMLLLVAVAMLTLVNPTKAETLFTCGASQGKAFYLSGPHVLGDKSGWADDAISGDSFSFLTLEDGSLDMVFSDATGRSYSARGDGGTVIAIYADTEAAQFVVHYPSTGVVGTYTIFADQGLVLWTEVKAATPIRKMSAFTAPCS